MLKQNKKSIVVLGIDPGLADTGYGFLKKQNGQLKILDYGRIKTKAKVPDKQRLTEIFNSLTSLIKKYQPDLVAVEKLFFCKNLKTAVAVGQARGVVLLAVGQANLDLIEFTPLQVKQALTTYGKADKKQVAAMVKVVLKMAAPPKSDDAADALAIAICATNYR